MRTCLTDEKLELLHRRRAWWLRALWWQHHLSRCPRCQARLEQFRADERLLQELRTALRAEGEASPLTAARNRAGKGESVREAGVED